MGTIRSIHTAADYIEANLATPLSAADVAGHSGYSQFHFLRMFQAVTGRSLKQYIRTRQMTEAARRLVEGDTPILDLALEFGFESQASFTRAFKALFTVPPGRFRREGVHYPSVYLNPITPKSLIQHNRGGKMKPKIVEKDVILMVGLRHYGSNQNREIPDLWHTFLQRADEIRHLGDPTHYYGLCTCPKAEIAKEASDTPFEYVAGREVTRFDDIPKDMVTRELPAATYAVFTHKGPLSSLDQTQAYVYGTWAKENAGRLEGDYDFEFYDENFDPAGSEDSEMTIYIPIKPSS